MAMQYSKEVMENFMNPKNMGEMKNPDATGRVGNARCGDIMEMQIKLSKYSKGKNTGKEYIKDIKFQTFGCLPPEEKVNTPEGWANIYKLKKGDLVYNRSLQETKIQKAHKGRFKGELYKIVPFISTFNSFWVTPTHPVLCIKRKWMSYKKFPNKKCSWLTLNKKELLNTSPKYIEAEFLEKGDYLIFPKSKKIKDNKKITKEIMKLLGYYLAEGYITAKGNALNFSFNKHEKKYIEETEKLIKKVTGKIPNSRIRKNICEVYVCSKKWCDFFEKHCNKIAKNKRLSNEIMLLPFEKQWEMIKTYVNGDGNIYRRRKSDSKTYRIDTASKKLAIQIQTILTRGDIMSSIKKFDRPKTEIEGRTIHEYTTFNVSFKLKKTHNFVKQTKDYFLIPVRKIGSKKFNGSVYNLEVTGKEHSFLVRGFVVHNCAAAISTSSMITQLAKGKTLEEAKKISKDDVAKALGDLPKIKMHCSNLADEGLKKAIENYEKQKNQGECKESSDLTENSEKEDVSKEG